MSTEKELIEKILAIPENTFKIRFTVYNSELRKLFYHELCNPGELRSLAASLASANEKVEVVKNAFEKAMRTHERMTTPTGVSGTTAHACEMCDAMNDLAAAIVAFDAAGGERTNQ